MLPVILCLKKNLCDKLQFFEQFRSVNIPPSVTLTEGGSLYLKSVQKGKRRAFSSSCNKFQNPLKYSQTNPGGHPWTATQY